MMKRMSDVTEPFLLHLQAHLKETGISRRSLAEMSGISVHTINVWFRDNRSPKVRDAVEIARALGVTIEELVEGRRVALHLPRHVSEVVEMMLECDEPYQASIRDIVRAYVRSLPELRTPQGSARDPQ